MESPRCVKVDDGNGNILTGLVFFNPDVIEEGTIRNVWVFANHDSGFGFDPGTVSLHELKKLGNGNWGS